MKNILVRLPKLTQQELATVRAACDHLLDRKQEVPAPALYLAMLDVLGQKVPSYSNFCRTASFRLWKKNLPDVERFISGLWPSMTKVEEASISCFLLQLLVDDLKELKVGIGIGTVSSNLGRVPELFDRSFPDYRASGMAGKVLAAMVSR